MIDVLVVLSRAAELLAERRDELDALNVFPVPDADTGTNMLATLGAALHGAEANRADPLAGAVEGALRGALGNSGVLLSQVLRGLLEAVASGGGLDARVLAAGLDTGERLAREAVADPVEGTLLTAARAAADAAVPAVPGGLVVTAAAAALAAHEAVDRTPDQNMVLARAGVVDAGARGLALVLEALAATVAGRASAPPPVRVPAVSPAELPGPGCDGDAGRWEVMFRLEAAAPDVAPVLREALVAVGGSVVVVGSGTDVQVHVHTDEIGPVLAAGMEHGVPLDVRVEDLEQRVLDPVRGRPGLLVLLDAPGLEPDIVAAGGVPYVVDVDHPPSVAMVLDAVGAVRGDPVVVLPGHPGLVSLVARAADVSRAEGGRELVVVPAVGSAPAALSALATVTDHRDVAALEAAGARVRAGRVVQGQSVAGVDGPTWRAMVDERVVGTDTEPLDALAALCLVLAERGRPEVVQVHLGIELALRVPGGGDAVAARLGELWPATAVELVDARQRSSLLVLGVE